MQKKSAWGLFFSAVGTSCLVLLSWAVHARWLTRWSQPSLLWKGEKHWALLGAPYSDGCPTPPVLAAAWSNTVPFTHLLLPGWSSTAQFRGLGLVWLCGLCISLHGWKKEMSMLFQVEDKRVLKSKCYVHMCSIDLRLDTGSGVSKRPGNFKLFVLILVSHTML